MTQTAVCLPARGGDGAARSALTHHVSSLSWLLFSKYLVFVFLTPAEQIISEVTFNRPGFIPFMVWQGEEMF